MNGKACGKVLVLLTWSACTAQTLYWPTDASRLLSSSFCEYRPGRFHAGIDIKTNGVVGHKVFAVRPGYVSRVSVSPFGYGRALYQVLDTGETAVYAHLSRFMEGIEERVYEEQERKGRFSVELHFRATEFPVAQGQVIAYTGQSGAAAPHLHFELRDRYNCPLNPLLFGLPVRDSRAPVINRLAIIPMDAHSVVDNDARPAVRVVRATAGGGYALMDAPEVWGRVGLAVSCFDQADGATNRFSVYSLRLVVDGKEAFRSEYQRFCYDQNRQMVLDREFRLEARGYGDFQRLFRDPNNSLRFYRSPFASAGVLVCGVEGGPEDLVLENGRHDIVVEAHDYAGNTAILSFPLLVAQPEPGVMLTAIGRGQSEPAEEVEFVAGEFLVPSVEDTLALSILLLGREDSLAEADKVAHLVGKRRARGTGALNIEQDFYDDYVRLVVRAPQRLVKPPSLAVWRDREKVFHLSSRGIGLATYMAVLPLNERHRKELVIEATAQTTGGDSLWGVSYVELWPVSPGQGGIVRSPDGLCEMRFEGGAVYRQLYARVEEMAAGPNSRVPAVGNAYRFEPTDVPLRGRARLTISLQEQQPNPEQLAIYSVGPKGVLSFVGNQLDAQGKKLRCSVSRLGTFAVVRDSVAPVIVALSPAQGEALTVTQPMLRVEFYDRLSGIGGEESIQLLLDGQRLIAEYDPPRRCAFYVPRKPLAKGPHRLSAIISDRCGNTAQAEHRFFIR